MERKTFYCNAAKARGTVFDVVVDFWQVVPTDEKMEQISDTLSVAMSPQHFKAFVEMVNAQLKTYEGIYGEIILKKTNEDDKES